MFTFQSGLDVAPSFSALTGSVKTDLGDNFALGLYTSQGNGVGIGGQLDLRQMLQLRLILRYLL